MPEMTDVKPDPLRDKKMKLRYAGVCRICGTELPAKTEAIYEPSRKKVRCLTCSDAPPAEVDSHPQARAQLIPEVEVQVIPEVRARRASLEGTTDPKPPTLDVHPRSESLEGSAPDEAPEAEPFDPGQAGASARREYERRKAKDEQRVRERFGRFSGIALAIRDERHTTAVWEQGAVGEERLGGMLDGLREHGILAMHDRRIPKSRANIDHIAVTPGGIWVIDSKRYKGRPDLLVRGGILKPRTEILVVGTRNCSRLVEGMLWQVGLVVKAVPDVPVKGVLCFIGSDWSPFSRGFTTRGVQVVWPRLLKKRLKADVNGDLDVDRAARQVAAVFEKA